MSRNGVGQFVSGRTILSYQNMLAVCEVLSVPIGILHIPDVITGYRVAEANRVFTSWKASI